MSRLITTSLLDSIDWCRKAPDSACPDVPGKTWKEKAYDDLKNTLGRGEWRSSPAIDRGNSFEKQIYSILTDRMEEKVACSDTFRKILYQCKGGEFQKKTKIIIELDDIDYVLYGRIDVFFPDHIIDIKTTGKYGGKDKYLSTAQHLIYCFSENIKDFEYVIAEFAGEESNDIRHVYNVRYHMEDRDKVEDELKNRIYSAMMWLENFPEPRDLKELYLKTYCRY